MTELIWESKYNRDQQRVSPLRSTLPFQTVETVNESSQERQNVLDLFSHGRDPEWRNRLIWGDKKYVLPSLLSNFAGRVDLIYIDPPFDTGADFSFGAGIPDAPDDGLSPLQRFVKSPNILEQKAYRDTWGRGLESYLQWFYETAVLLCELLTDGGSIYVHLDWRVVHYAKIVLDEVFGRDRFQNEIIWIRSLPHGNIDYKFGSSHDTILRYSKGDGFTWNPQYSAHREEYLRDFYKYAEPDGRVYRLISCINPNPNRPNLTYEWNGVTKVWKFSRDRMQRMDAEGLLVYSKGGTPSYKGYLDTMRGVPMQDVWTDIPPLMGSGKEWVEYPTQKPIALLERIIQASSDEGDLVLDCFVGSGTTALAAEKTGRRWIATDLGRFAVHTTRKRLLSTQGVRPFVIENLGKYERQAWQAAEFGEAADLRYRRFILDLYKAQPLSGYVWLHGNRAGTFVHVGSVDAPVTTGDVKSIVLEYRRAIGSGADAPTTSRIDVLGWDFAFELNEVAKQQAALANVDLHFVRIPREVLEKRAVEQGDIKFFELAALAVDVHRQDRTVTLELKEFVIPLDDVPDDVQRAVTHWTQWIDYWAVDWNNHDDTFHNEWQTYRTRKDPSLQKSAGHMYEDPGCYAVVVKVIDILGNDTTKTLQVEVA
jgi:adenine-specific DNA-methyltransferase